MIEDGLEILKPACLLTRSLFDVTENDEQQKGGYPATDNVALLMPVHCSRAAVSPHPQTLI
jgi:hypothetical protein